MNLKNTKTNPLIIGLCSLTLIISSIALIILYKSKSDYPASIAANHITKLDSKSEQQYKDLSEKFSSVLSTFEIIHQMANSKIEAEDGLVYGKIDITPGRCKALLEFYSNNKQEAQEILGETDYKTLVDGIIKWSNGDYSKSARIHNLVWARLGGADGKAKED